MEVKTGYKRTAVGVIPEEWEPSTIGEIATFSGGSQPPRSTFRFSPTPGYVRLIQIRDYKTDDYATFIPESMARKRCTSADIMIGRYGPPIFQILRGIEGAYNVALIKTVPNPRRIEREYLFSVLKTERLFQLIDSLSRRSSGQTGVEMPALKAYGIPLPPLAEQRVIAEALTDVNALLGGIDRLISKKRDVRRAAMQKLINGQLRLPGFQSDWETGTLGSFFEIKKGEPITEVNAVPGSVPVIAGGRRPAYYHNRANRFGKTVTISGSGASAGYVSFHTSPIFASDCSTIGEGKHYSIEFVFYLLQSRQDEIYRGQTGGAQPHIHPNDLRPMVMSIPPLTEQIAIAEVLRDMDAEVKVLEHRRDKTFALKKAMMQELLTGRTRLPLAEASA